MDPRVQLADLDPAGGHEAEGAVTAAACMASELDNLHWDAEYLQVVADPLSHTCNRRQRATHHAPCDHAPCDYAPCLHAPFSPHFPSRPTLTLTLRPPAGADQARLAGQLAEGELVCGCVGRHTLAPGSALLFSAHGTSQLAGRPLPLPSPIPHSSPSPCRFPFPLIPHLHRTRPPIRAVHFFSVLMVRRKRLADP
jgi:hypothetical protein